MTQIRLRRHTDGRVAIQVAPEGSWHILSPENRQFHIAVGTAPRTESGWSELLVAELPEPYGYRQLPNENPFWVLSFASQQLTVYSGEVSVMYIDGLDVAYAPYRTEQELDDLRADGLRILAAVAACEKYRAERDKT